MSPIRLICPITKSAGTSHISTIECRIQRAKVEKEEIESGLHRIYLSGRLDILGVRQIENDFTEMTSSQKRSVIVDLSGVELLSSVGLGLLISNANVMNIFGKRMILFKPKPRVERVIRIVCLDKLLPIEYDLSIALSHIKSASVVS